MTNALLPALFALATVPLAASAATITLYDQDFEAPTGYVNDGGDVNILRSVNQLYGGQPPGFAFDQDFTVETLNVTGTARGGGSAAFGTGYSDPGNVAGDYVLGMLSGQGTQEDRLRLSFDVGAFAFFNVGIDVSSIDLSTFGGPFVAPGAVPVFRFSLYDNPGGGVGGKGSLLSSYDLAGTASTDTVLDFTAGLFGLGTAGNTNGNVTLEIDLLQGGYAAFDNLVLTAADDPPEPPDGVVPLPAALPLLLGALAALPLFRRRA